jgi:predicted Fe-Mo cluster-binding NifX family protein
MKIAITSSGNSIDSKLDQRFGRCTYLVIYDTHSGGVEFLPNPNKEADDNAGLAIVKIISDRNIEKVISGEFGVKVKPLLDSFKVQMIMLKQSEKTLQEIINILNH